jgi:hypothetical protein
LFRGKARCLVRYRRVVQALPFRPPYFTHSNTLGICDHGLSLVD